MLLEKGRGQLDEFLPGEKLSATGVVAHRSGLPVLVLENAVKEGRREPPAPVKVQLRDLTQFQNIGRYVILESYIVTTGQNSGGDVVIIGGRGVSITVFYPRHQRWSKPGLGSLEAGDKVRVTGIASQYCPVAPYDRGFQVIVDDPSQVVMLEKGWIIPPDFVLYLLIGLVGASVIWWLREHGMAEQRRTIRSMMALSEEVLSANSVGEIARKVQKVLPALLKAWNVDLYLFSRTRNTLDCIPNELTPLQAPIALDRPKGVFAAAVALCFRNRALLKVPDFRKSPVADVSDRSDLPASAVFVPMFAKGEVIGVMAVPFRRRLHANLSQHAALQHVGNQIAAALKLQEQQSMRAQLLRTEKMAAAGQLISAVAHDLRAPLNAIREASSKLEGAGQAGIVLEADRGLQIVNHLLSFARMERSEARPVNLYQLVSGVMEAREPEWRRKGLQVENALPVTPMEVFVDESELEQVVLSVLIHVEHAVEDHPGNPVRVSSRVLGNRLQITVDFAGPSELSHVAEEPTSGDSFGLRVCQAIAQSHGGDIRLYERPHGGYRYELELPVYHAPLPMEISSGPSRHASRVLTAIIIEPDASLRRRLLAMLSARGHRAIPVESAEEAADMVQRMQFDLIFCTLRLPGLSWQEFFKRVRRRIAAFVLLLEAHDPEIGGALKDGAGFVLRKPLEEEELEALLTEVEGKTSTHA